MPDREKVIKALECCERKDGNECKVCPYTESEYCTEDMAHDARELLKEQEAKKGHWIFESAYCEAWSHTCSECGKRMTTAYNTYANYCWNCGAKMEGR